MSASRQRWLTALRSCCKTSLEKTRILLDSFTASQAFPSAHPSSWKLSLRSLDVYLESEPAHVETRNRVSHHSRPAWRVVIAETDGSGLQFWRTRVVRGAWLVTRIDQGSGSRDSLPYIEAVRNELVGVDARRRRPN